MRRYKITAKPTRHARVKRLRHLSPKQFAAHQRELKAAAQRRRNGLPAPLRAAPKRCECCGHLPGVKALNLDHDHTSGRFRGWLCVRCNLGLGCFRDSPELLHRAINYLTIFQE